MCNMHLNLNARFPRKLEIEISIGIGIHAFFSIAKKSGGLSLKRTAVIYYIHVIGYKAPFY